MVLQYSGQFLQCPDTYYQLSINIRSIWHIFCTIRPEIDIKENILVIGEKRELDIPISIMPKHQKSCETREILTYLHGFLVS